MAQTIIMIHGMFAGGWCWDKYKGLFEEKGYHCITPTLRFHEMTPKDSPNPQLGTVSLLDYAEDLEKEIRKLDSVPILMGHSMGGLLAQILGCRGLAKALVLLTPASPRGIMALKPSVMKTFWSAQTKWGFWKKPFRLTFNEVAYSMLQLRPVEDQRAIFNKFVYESGRAAYEVGYWFLDRKRASEVDESKIDCPVLVVAGGHDKATPTSIIRQVADKYRAVSTYKEYDNHSHWVISEPGWQEIVEYTMDWLNQVLSEYELDSK